MRGTVNPEVVSSIPAKTQNPENSDLYGFELRKPSGKGAKLHFQVIKAIINQWEGAGGGGEGMWRGGGERRGKGWGAK